MKSILQKRRGNKFIENVTIMASGTAIAQIVSFLLIPIITRLYGPEAYGIMGAFTALIGIFAPIVALTYPIAIVLPKDDKDAIGIARLSVYITFFVTILSFLIIFFFKEPIVDLFNIENISRYLYLIPFTLLSAGLLQVIEQWLIRKKKFHVSARTAIFQSLLLQGSKAGVGYIHPTASVLVTLTALTHGLKSILMIFFSKISLKNIIRVLYKDKLNIKKLAKEHNDFPLFRAPQTLIDATTISIPILFLTSFFGPVVAGYYTLAKTTLNVPIDLIAKAVGDVFYPRISDAATKGENLTRIIYKSTLFLTGLGIIPLSLFILFGPELFAFIFGDEWTMAGSYARWVALWSFSSFILQPSLRSLPVLHAQAFHLNFTIVSLVVRLVLLVVGNYVFSSDLVVIAIFGASSALFNVILILFAIYKSKKFN